MNSMHTNTRIAGIDVGKARLDVALAGDAGAAFDCPNTAAGHDGLIARLGELGVRRVGLEASGGYERAVRERLAAAGLEVVVHQPLEVRLFARLRRRRAKNDRLDAALIAEATAHVETLKAAADPRLADLAERLTAYEQASDLVTQLKTHLEHTSLPDLLARLHVQLTGLLAHKQALARDLEQRLRAHADLARRFELVRSLPGVGVIVALGLVIRMPELGAMRLGQPAALLGVAPFDRDSGAARGQRHIAGGRSRPRRLIYLAALAARRCDPACKAFADRLASAGKAPKLVIVAIMRKLIEAANLILKRDTPWTTQPA
jgi:transposase